MMIGKWPCFRILNFSAAQIDGTGISTYIYHTNRIHRTGIFIYLHSWLVLMINAGKYTIHGSYGVQIIINQM